MAVIMQFKRGTKEVLKKVNILLYDGEPCYEMDTSKLKIGDGKHRWNELPYVNSNLLSVKTHSDFPPVGKSDVLYKAEEESKIYQWNSTTNSY